MKRTPFTNQKPSGKCPICTINKWSFTGDKPAIMPCNVANCPYPKESNVVQFPRSVTGSSLLQITG